MGQRPWHSARPHSKLGLDAGFSLKTLPWGCQCLRTTVPQDQGEDLYPIPLALPSRPFVSPIGGVTYQVYVLERSPQLGGDWVGHETEIIRGGEKKDRISQPGASLPGVGWTDSLGLAPGFAA